MQAWSTTKGTGGNQKAGRFAQARQVWLSWCVTKGSLGPLAKFGPLEELNSGNDDDQANDRQDQQILPDDRVRNAAGVDSSLFSNPASRYSLSTKATIMPL